MRKLICGMSAAVVALAASIGIAAPIPAPTVYWQFNNEDGQSSGNFDGVLNSGPGSLVDIDLRVNQRNGAAGQPFSFFLPPVQAAPGVVSITGYPGITAINGANTAPNEHYVGGQFGNAYHLEGGRHRNYNPQDTVLDPQLDPVVGLPIGDKFSRRDMLRIAGDANGALNNSVITTAFWLNIQLATAVEDSARFSTNSMILGRGTGGSTFAGEISIKHATGVEGDEKYRLGVRSDPVITQTAAVLDGKQWYHVVVEYDLSGAGPNTGTATVHLDGGLANGGITEIFNGLGNATIGGTFWLNQVAHPGANLQETGDFYLDDFGMWVGQKLTAADILRIRDLGIEAAMVPEPSGIILALGAVLGLMRFRRTKKS